MLSFPTEISDIFHACYTDLFNKYVPSHSLKGKNHSTTADSNTGMKSWRDVCVDLKNAFYSQFKLCSWCKKIFFWAWSVRIQNCLECNISYSSVAHLAAVIFFSCSCISYNAKKYHLLKYLLPQFPVTTLQVVFCGCVSAQLSYLWEATRHLVDPTCHLDFQPPGGNWPSPCYSSDHLRHQSLKL